MSDDDGQYVAGGRERGLRAALAQEERLHSSFYRSLAVETMLTSSLWGEEVHIFDEVPAFFERQDLNSSVPSTKDRTNVKEDK